MKKRSFLLFCLPLLLTASVCIADGETFSYRFADAEEASELLLANRDYFENLNQNNLNFRMQKSDAAVEELEAFAAKQTRDWTDAEKTLVDDVMLAIEKICEDHGYSLPQTDEIIFAKTTMLEECKPLAYTHGTEIYLGEAILSDGLNGKSSFQKSIVHEIFHCLTRFHPDFRETMYGILGFTVVDEDYHFPQEISDLIIANPDVEHHNAYAAFDINGEMKDCVVIFTTKEPFKEPGDSFFTTMLTGLVPIDDLSLMYTAEEASYFWNVFGKNTRYVIDPEETLADNFAFTIIYGPDGKNYENPEIIEAIDAYLKGYERQRN